MFVLIGGVVLIAAILILSMAVPILHYLKRDQQWMNSDRTREEWYRIQHAK